MSDLLVYVLVFVAGVAADHFLEAKIRARIDAMFAPKAAAPKA